MKAPNPPIVAESHRRSDRRRVHRSSSHTRLVARRCAAVRHPPCGLTLPSSGRPTALLRHLSAAAHVNRSPAASETSRFGNARSSFLSTVTSLVLSLVASAMNSQSYAVQSLSNVRHGPAHQRRDRQRRDSVVSGGGVMTPNPSIDRASQRPFPPFGSPLMPNVRSQSDG
jgi:hypothetical protein